MARSWCLAAVIALSAAIPACATVSNAPSPSSITLTKAVHFSRPEGTSVIAQAGAYRVEDAGDGQLRLIPQDAGAVLVIQAQATKYDEPLNESLALSIPYQEDEHHVVLLRTDGKALDAVGNYSGVTTRAPQSMVLSSSVIQSQWLLQRQKLAGTQPPPPSTPGAVSAAFSGPTDLIAGMKGTFELKLMPLPPSRTQSGTGVIQDSTWVIQGASFTFDSNDGETAVASLPGPSSSPASLFATFTFQNPGTYRVSVSGTATSLQTITEAVPVYQTRSTYDSGCNCYRSSTVHTGYNYVTRQAIKSQQLSAQHQLTVKP